MLVAWLLLSVCLDRAQTLIALPNYGARWNGIGAIEETLAKTTQAPMAYRVLVPWIVGAARKLGAPILETYQVLKVILMAGAFMAVHLAWGWETALVTAIILVATFQYDYWDWAPEMIGISLAIAGVFPLAIAGAVIHALSRETAMLIPLAYYLSTNNLPESLALLFVVGMILALVRFLQGKHPLYCDRWMVKRNLEGIKAIRNMRPFWLSGTFISLVICGLAAAFSLATGALAIIPLALIVSGWTMAVAEESRVFSSVIPWVAYACIRLWMP